MAILSLETQKLYELHRRPALFHVTKVASKTIGDVVQSQFRTSLRIHFCCEKCGCLAPSGIKPGASAPGYWNRLKAALSLSSAEHPLGGYELSVDRPWFAKFKVGMELAFEGN